MKTKDRIPRDTRVRFQYMDEFTGKTVEKVGLTRGLPKDIRIRWPEEFAELPDDAHCYLIEPEVHDPNLKSPFYVVWEEDILEILKKEEQ
jgi:hypothetical protein